MRQGARTGGGRTSLRRDAREGREGRDAATPLTKSLPHPHHLVRDSIRGRQEFSFDTPKSAK
eukprot:637757-Hanusia_phi.AAC.1